MEIPVEYNSNFATPAMRRALHAGVLLILITALAVPCAADFITDTLGSAGPSNWAIFVGPGTAGLTLSGAGTTGGNVGCGVCTLLLSATSNAPIPNTAIEGNLYLGGGASVINGTQVSGTILTNQNLTQSLTDALNASATFAALAGQSIGSITGTTTITAANPGGLNVLNISSLSLGSGQTLTLSGPAGTEFIINDTGGFALNSGRINLTGGLTFDDVVFNETGSGSALSATSAGVDPVVNGILLAPNRAVDFSPGLIDGELIAGGSTVSLRLGASVNPPAAASVPEPSTYTMLGTGLLGLTILLYLKGLEPGRSGSAAISFKACSIKAS